jgi:hypothetical protein
MILIINAQPLYIYVNTYSIIQNPQTKIIYQTLSLPPFEANFTDKNA